MGKQKSGKGKQLPYRPCVGIMVLNNEDRVWCGHRLTLQPGELTMADKRWQMPQGGIDKGEDPLDAARRELWEETGMTSVKLLGRVPGPVFYDLPDHLVGKALKGKYRGQEMIWYAFRFEGAESEINIDEPPEGAPVEFDHWKWVDMETLPELVVPFKKGIYDEVVSAFRHLVSRP